MLWAFAGALLIAAGAHVNVPLDPVPMTLQTLGVLLVAGIGGKRIGVGAAAFYLLLVLVGAPILADGNSAAGRAFLELKSAGYVVGFLPAAYVCRFHGRGLPGTLAAMILAHVIILVTGVAWLSHHVGRAAAIEHGALPFLKAAVIKSILAAILVHYFVNLRRR